MDHWVNPAAMKVLDRREADGGPANMDALGLCIISFIILCSVLLALGVTFLLYHRRLDFIRIRNVPLMISALLMIHVYLIFACLTYPLNGTFPCNLEFWIMSVYFPTGVALYQAYNMQLLSLSVLQKKLLIQPAKLLNKMPPPRRTVTGLRDRWSRLNLQTRTYLFIAVGVVIQLVLVLIVFLVSRKFHTFGVISKTGNARSCRRGWEWIPSALWQGFWTWGFGPWLLFKIRKIHDTHRWRLQTTLVIIFNLPGMPLWLSALYFPAFKPINLWWTPAMWYLPGLLVMEITMILFPLWEVYENKRDRRATAAAIADWESKSLEYASFESPKQKSVSTENAENQGRASMNNLAAMEKTLEKNPRDLLEFAATKQFTGENIVFLTRVRAWKEQWVRAALIKSPMSQDAKSRLYEAGKELFDRNISLHTAQFPINLESKVYQELEVMFGSSMTSPLTSIITPFADLWGKSEMRDSKAGFEEIIRLDERTKPGDSEETLATPYGFDGQVFDNAERSIKYMVFTNTWGRYLESSRKSLV